MKFLVFAAALSLAAPVAEAEQPPLTAQKVEQDPVGAGRAALAQLGEDVVDAHKPLKTPLLLTRRLDDLLIQLKPHGTHVRGLCERQQLRVDFEPTPAAHAELATLDPSHAGYADPEVRARSLAVQNHYIPLAGYIAGARQTGDDEPACAALVDRGRFVEAPSAGAADDGLALVDRIRDQAKTGRLEFEFVCTLEQAPCPATPATLQKLLAMQLERVANWRGKGSSSGTITEGELSGSLKDDRREWWADVTALNGAPTRVVLHIATPAPS